MATKIQLTITPDMVDAAMARTIGTLQRLGVVPMRKITLAIECQDDEAEDLEDTIDAALSARPVGIEVVMKTTKERHVTRDAAMPRVTPMDEAIRQAPPADTVIRLDREHYDALEKAGKQLRAMGGTPVGTDAPPR
jgi:hypothetical protein